MARTRAERRHHMWRMKANRRTDWNIGNGGPRALGQHYRTPCNCSCWMCGHQRQGHGMNMQELRARARYTD